MMTPTEVLHALVEKTFEQFKDEGITHKWKDDNIVEVFRKGKPLTRVGVEDYCFYSISDLVLAVFDALYDSRKEVAVVEKKELRNSDYKLEGYKKLRELTIYHSTSDEDFYYEIDKEKFEDTICHDERTKVLVFVEETKKTSSKKSNEPKEQVERSSLLCEYEKLSKFAIEMLYYANHCNYRNDWENFESLIKELKTSHGMDNTRMKQWEVVKKTISFDLSNLTAFFDKTCDVYFLRFIEDARDEFELFKSEKYIYLVRECYPIDTDQEFLDLMSRDFDSMAMENFISRLEDEVMELF